MGGDAELPLFKKREVKTTACVRGHFRSRAVRCLQRQRGVQAAPLRGPAQGRARPRLQASTVYGRKGYGYFHRLTAGYKVEKFFVEPPLDKMDFDAARRWSRSWSTAFETGVVDEVRVFYTRSCRQLASHPPSWTSCRFPTTELEDDARTAGRWSSTICSSRTQRRLLNRLVPRYLETVIYGAMLESLGGRARLAPHGDEGRDRRRESHAHRSALKKVYNRGAPGEHHQGAARHRRRRRPPLSPDAPPPGTPMFQPHSHSSIFRKQELRIP